MLISQDFMAYQTRQLNQQVKRNADRFPEDFMFQLSWEEVAALRSQIVILNGESASRARPRATTLKRGEHLKFRPFAFTEHGAIMAATVLNSPQAVSVSVIVVRAFVKLREMLSAHRQLAQKLAELERKLENHDAQIAALFEAIRQLMEPPPEPPRKPIGFTSEMNGSQGALVRRKKRK